MTSQFADNVIRQFSFFDVAVFLLSRLVTGPVLVSISSLVLDFWQFSFIRERNWPEILQWEIIPVWVLPNISGYWDELGTPNLVKNVSHGKLLNASKCQGDSFYHFWVTASTTEGGGQLPPPPPPGLENQSDGE